MSLIKKDLIALADMIRNLIPTPNASADSGVYHIPGDSFTGAVRQWEKTRDALADFCAAQNPRLNRARWLAYIAGECGPNGDAINSGACKVHHAPDGELYVAYCTCGVRNPHSHA